MRNDCPVRCLRTAFRTCREDPILSAANEKSGRKRLIYAICCDRIVIPIYGAFSSRRTADIPGVHRIGGARGRHGASDRNFALLAPTGTAFSKPKLSQSRSFCSEAEAFKIRLCPNPTLLRNRSAAAPKLPYIIFISAAGGGKAE